MTQPEIPREARPFERLLAEARAGSMDALGKALQACQWALSHRAKRFLRPASLRVKISDSDLVQTTFLEAQRSFVQFQGTTQDEFLAWLFGILLHNVQDMRTRFMQTGKRELKREEISLDDERAGPVLEQVLITKNTSPETKAQEREIKEALLRSFRALPERYQRVIRLHSWERLPYEDIGHKLGCSPEAARKLHQRAIHRLSESIRGIG
jgi:RNA polymerase sigma-70 factor (ECF subfamily)